MDEAALLRYLRDEVELVSVFSKDRKPGLGGCQIDEGVVEAFLLRFTQ
ncbi:MAG TPA: hypothetical protein VKQ54_08000 [Caulobacteraceae bacterium]|nr:hypothetical protein [Caulobacteraceae bacterium]